VPGGCGVPGCCAKGAEIDGRNRPILLGLLGPSNIRFCRSAPGCQQKAPAEKGALDREGDVAIEPEQTPVAGDAGASEAGDPRDMAYRNPLPLPPQRTSRAPGFGETMPQQPACEHAGSVAPNEQLAICVSAFPRLLVSAPRSGLLNRRARPSR